MTHRASQPIERTADNDARAAPDERRRFFENRIAALVDRLYGTALRLTGNTHDAEDLVADTVTNAWRRLDQLEDRAGFDGWIMRSLSNRFVSDLRKKRPEVFLEDQCAGEEPGEDGFLYGRLHSPFILWWGGRQREFTDNLLREDIERAVGDLADGYRMVFVMVEIMGYRYDETADQLGLPVGTVRSRLNRARRQLQKALWTYRHNDDDSPAGVQR